VVEITDETGKPVDAAAVSFRMPEEGPGAVFPKGMRTDIRTTTPDGRAAVHEFVAGRLTGPFQIRVTAVKNGVRAGTIVSQYVSEAKAIRSAGVRTAGPTRKWLAILAVAGGAAAGGMVAIRGASPAGAAATAVASPQIGIPAFTVGGPQ